MMVTNQILEPFSRVIFLARNFAQLFICNPTMSNTSGLSDNNKRAPIAVKKQFRSISWTSSAWNDDSAQFRTPPKKTNASVEGVTNSMDNMNINANKTPVRTLLSNSTTLEEKMFEDDSVLVQNEIYHGDLEASIDECVEKEGRLKNLLNEILQAYNSEGTEVPAEDKQFLDYEPGDCDYILSKKFKEDMETIPDDNEGEWIAECHNRLSRLFRQFPTWRSNSVVSSQINEKLKPDRIFGFSLGSKSTTRGKFVEWTTGIHWPFLLIESKPLSAKNEIGDTWKMAIIQAFGWEQQNSVLDSLKLPEPYYFTEHAPLNFGVYYVGQCVNITIYFEVEGRKCFLMVPELDIKTSAAKILKIFAVMKRHSHEVHQSVMKAFGEGNWKKALLSVPKTKPLSKKNLEEKDSKSSGTSKPEHKSDSSGSVSDALSHNLYQNHRTKVDLVTNVNQQQQYIIKTTRVNLGKREYVVLGHLQGLSCVPKLLHKPVIDKDNITLFMSYCPGVHPVNFSTLSELQTFMKELLLVLHQLHKHKIVHNDIKEGNLLWDSTANRVYLIDFGSATTINGETEHFTRGYCAPDPYKTPASDVYSAGIVLANLILGVGIRSELQAYLLAQCENVAQAMKWKARNAISFGEATLCNEISLDLARRMIAKDINRRISIESALKHQFFNATVAISVVNDVTKLMPPTEKVHVLA